MNNNNFWSDASRYGAIYGAVEILFLLLASLLQGNSLMGMVLNLFHISIFITLLYLFTQRRARLYSSDEGFSFGQGLKYMLALSLFAGIVSGAYEIFAHNILFPELYREANDTIVATLAQTKLYTTAQLAEVKALYEKMLFSPLWVLLVHIFGMLLRGLFFGLIISAFTRRRTDIFSTNTPEE